MVSEAGDTLIEVLISALLVGLIVVGTFSGLNSTNRATSINRARSQANALAEQDEERLRSLPVATLAKLELAPTTQPVELNGSKYEVISSAKYIVDNTATTSCATTTPSAEYIQTSSTVKSRALGTTQAVVETGIVSPPPGTSLIVQVTGASGEGVAGMEAQIVGPSTASALTSSNGCAILVTQPGEYEVNVHQTNFVDQNWIAESKEDPFYQKSVFLPAETTTKKSYIFAPAASLNPLKFEELNPTTGLSEPTKALNASLENPEMSPSVKLLRAEGSSEYLSTIIQAKKEIFPFPAAKRYTLYAGSCSANRPVEEKNRTTHAFAAGKEESVSLVLPSLIVRVWQGVKGEATPKQVGSAPEVFLSDTDENCEHTDRKQETIVPTTAGGALKYRGQPWGTYTVCVNVAYKNLKTGKTENKHISETGVKNNNPTKTGTSVEMYEGGPEGKAGPKGEGLEAESCP